MPLSIHCDCRWLLFLSEFIGNRTITIIWGILRTLLHLLQKTWCFGFSVTLWGKPCPSPQTWVGGTYIATAVTHIFLHAYSLAVSWTVACLLSVFLLEYKIHKSRDAVHLCSLLLANVWYMVGGQEIFAERLTSPRTELLVKNNTQDQSSTDVNIAFFHSPPSLPLHPPLELLLLFFLTVYPCSASRGFPDFLLVF